MAKTEKIEVTVSSGNIFVDLGLADAEELNAKLQIIVSIVRILEQRKLNNSKAARLLGVTVLKVMALKQLEVDDFSIERLMHFANVLDYDVVIQLKQRPAKEGAARVVVEVAA